MRDLREIRETDENPWLAVVFCFCFCFLFFFWGGVCFFLACSLGPIEIDVPADSMIRFVTEGAEAGTAAPVESESAESAESESAAQPVAAAEAEQAGGDAVAGSRGSADDGNSAAPAAPAGALTAIFDPRRFAQVLRVAFFSYWNWVVSYAVGGNGGGGNKPRRRTRK
jgi:hypothetical protein